MKLWFPLIGLMHILPLICYCQDEYYSKQEDKYFKKAKQSLFVPFDHEEIMNFSKPYFRIDTLEDFTLFTGANQHTPHSDTLFGDKPFNSNSGIPKEKIVSYACADNYEAVVYIDKKYDDAYLGEPGYWLAMKEEGKWKMYYLGLSVNNPVHLKYSSDLALIKDGNILQMEAAFVNLVQQKGHPGPPPKYELVKDGILLQINIDSIKKDTDRDGLTDIEERKLMLNPDDVDTDNDRIVDFLDMNPRFISRNTNVSEVYEFILQFIDDPLNFSDTVINVGHMHPISKVNDTTKTYLIVSDNPDLQYINPQNGRYVILSSDEYALHKEIYPNDMSAVVISPFFQVDEMENTRKIHIISGPNHLVFVITRHRYVWEIKIHSIQIS